MKWAKNVISSGFYRSFSQRKTPPLSISQIFPFSLQTPVYQAFITETSLHTAFSLPSAVFLPSASCPISSRGSIPFIVSFWASRRIWKHPLYVFRSFTLFRMTRHVDNTFSFLRRYINLSTCFYKLSPHYVNRLLHLLRIAPSTSSFTFNTSARKN